MKLILFLSSLLLALPTFSHPVDFNSHSLTPIYADIAQLKKAEIQPLYSDEATGVAYAMATGEMLSRLSEITHQEGRCGSFEALPKFPELSQVAADFKFLEKMNQKNLSYSVLANPPSAVQESTVISDALAELNANNIKETVAWLSSYPTRFNKGADANKHVIDFQNKLKEMTAGISYPISIDLITHKNTPQKSIRLSIKGASRPNEIIVMGGHLDSTVGWFASGKAPGADDNASGSSSLLEALRVILKQQQPERTIEFFWYAGEESGLLGSTEIAESYKVEKKTVIAVLQLDMTMFPGDGENKIASMSDFTSAWLRDYLKAINETYLKVEILDSQCGYGCSDHASWHRRGYPTLMPAEATMNNMFKDLHTIRDVISPIMSFTHSLIFSKIAVIMALDLGNSTDRAPVF